MFVTPVSEEEEAKLKAEAFQKAKAQAASLAAAAGVKIGDLQTLHVNEMSQIGREAYNPYDQSYNYTYQVMQSQAAASAGSNKREAIGMQPGKVSYQVTVGASFAIK
jgi:uncharacterized protein YggE